MQKCPVTVIIPTYNREPFLCEAILSVLHQHCLPAEIIIVDDGSTDATRESVMSIAADSAIDLCYIFQPNSGVARARNIGIANAHCEYIAFLDSDDRWLRDKLQKQYDCMVRNPRYDISHTREKWLRRGTHLNQKKKHLPQNGDIFEHCLQLCAVGMSTVMAKRELLYEVGLFDPGYCCCEDYELWLRVSSRHPFLLVDEQLTIKQGGRDDQLSFRHRIGMDRFRIDALEKLLAEAHLTRKQRESAKKELMKKLAIYGNGCLRHGREAEGRRCLDRIRELQS